MFPSCSNQPRDRQSYPDAQAIETVEQAREESRACKTTQMKEDIPRSILGVEEMRYAPYTKHSKN
jgi:hypothetical protein